MNRCLKCLKITFSQQNMPFNFLRSVVQKNAQKRDIEGIAQLVATDKKVRIIACGIKGSVDDFVDVLHKSFTEHAISEVEIEPFRRDKDYRNVFRIIE